MTTSTEGLRQSGGVEMRVHGVGDRGVFGALGKPVYTGTVADRVRIGSLPLIPSHELKLIHWSRPTRRIARTVNWYLAYPFTLVNMAGFMGPERSEDRAERRLWWFMRTAVTVSSVMMTVAMAMWMSAIVETAWRPFGGEPHGLGGAVLGVLGPGVLAAVVITRMVRGRSLVDRGNTGVAALTLAVLIATAGYLAGTAVNRTGALDSDAAIAGASMTATVCVSTAVVWGFAIALCWIAWRAESRRKGYGWSSFRPTPDRTALAGAGMLIAVAIALLHTVCACLRLVLQTVVKYTPPVIERRAQGLHDGSRVVAEAASYGRFDEVLPIDLAPVLFVMVASIFGALIWREYRRRAPVHAVHGASPRRSREPVPSHLLLRDTHEFFSRSALVAMLTSLGLAIALIGVIVAASDFGWETADLLNPLFVALESVALLLLVVIVVRRPGRATEYTKRFLEMLADVAGFWAPDLHPLAGASYRLAVLHGLRRGIHDVRKDQPDKPIALVGHSQGAVICAWFIRGGYWREKMSERVSDETALMMRMHDAPGDQADRIALFTCGSPLGSLYRTFFPRYFDEDFFSSAARKSYGKVWHNYWRKTDPVGARLNRGATQTTTDARVRDVDVTETETEAANGHYEYWQEDRVRADIEEYFASFGLVAGQSASAGALRHGRLRGLRNAIPRLHLHGN
jgi:hypothetical protein